MLAKGFGFFLLAVVSGLAVYLLLAPHLLNPDKYGSMQTASPGSATALPEEKADSIPPVVSGISPGNSTASEGIAPPLPPAVQQETAVEEERAPYYRWILTTFPGIVLNAAPDANNRAILKLTLSRDDSQTVNQVAQNVVAAQAGKYGFVHARLYSPDVQSQPGSYHLCAEVDKRPDGHWDLILR